MKCQDGSAAKTNMSVFIESLDAGIVVWSKLRPAPAHQFTNSQI